jgi:phosphoglucomutase
MNKYNVRRATAGLAEYLKLTPGEKERGVAIGYDSRNRSEEYAKETALLLAARGVKAYLFDALRPVALLSFALRRLNTAAGVVVTASHNPPEYNGYKVYGDDGAQVSPEAAAKITEIIYSTPYEECVLMDEQEAIEKGLLTYIGKEIDDAYDEMVLALSVQPELLKKEGKNLRIVYTPLHGSGNVPVRRVLKKAGLENVTVVKEQEEPDGNFPTVSAPNPENPDAFELAIPLAEEVGATVIFGTDPDCDRLGVCVKDSEGVFRVLTGNQIGCLMLYHILTSKKAAGTLPANAAVCKSLVSTQLADTICKDFGVAMYDTLTGFKFIGEKIQQFEDTGEHTYVFGFEESYGYLSGTDVRDKDGVNASLLIAEAACVCMHEGITLYDRLQEIYDKYGYWVENVHSSTLPGKDGLEKMASIMGNLHEHSPEKIGDFKVVAVRDYLKSVRTEGDKVEPLDYVKSDVLYYELEDGHWLCVRPSGTEPKIKLYVNTQADTLEEAEKLNKKLLDSALELVK